MDKIVEGYMSVEEDGELADEEDLFADGDDCKPATRKDERVINNGKQCIEINNKTTSTPVDELRDKRAHNKQHGRLCPRMLKEHRPLCRQHEQWVSVQHHRHSQLRGRKHESIQHRKPRLTGLRIIAFSARLRNDSRYSMTGDVVKFDKVIMNEGHAYNPENGTFVCPEPGMYVLMWNISAPVGNTSTLVLKINGLIKNRITSKRRIDEVDQGIFRLKADDCVWISFCHGCRNIIAKYSKFGGIRISE